MTHKLIKLFNFQMNPENMQFCSVKIMHVLKYYFIVYDGFREVNVKREERKRKGKSAYRNWREN